MPFLRTRPALRGMLIVALLLAAVGVSAGTAQASPLPTLSLAITSSSITVGGTTQSGAVNVVSTATHFKEPSVLLFQLKPGATFAEVEAAIQAAHGEINVTSKFGSIVFDTEVTPGQTSEVQTDLQPGQYVAVVPAEKGSRAHANFTVTASATPATLPTPQATVRSIEFGFRGPSTLHDGELVRFENGGYLVHMDLAFAVKSKKDARKALKGLATGHEKGLEKLAAGPPANFAGPLSPGAFQQETITAKPGYYVQVCFMPTQDGRPHTLLGMERIIRIVK